MRLARLATVAALAIGVTTFAAAASAATSGNPTAAQIKKAVTQAERSKSLWATVNICNSARYPDTIGVRGQMPSLGFPAWLSMKIQLDYYSTASRQFVPLPGGGGTHTTRLGRSSSKLQQGGATWIFNMPVLLNATITFVWKREGKLLGETSQTTVAGHPNAQFGSPQHYSAKQCRLP
jgi:hypothetical protein